MEEVPGYRTHRLTRSEGGGFIVEFIAYPQCQGWGSTPEMALEAARRVLERARSGNVGESSSPMIHWRLPTFPPQSH